MVKLEKGMSPLGKALIDSFKKTFVEHANKGHTQEEITNAHLEALQWLSFCVTHASEFVTLPDLRKCVEHGRDLALKTPRLWNTPPSPPKMRQ